ncbi:MAG: methionyl-tRNA formyltransferase [Roseburia sp.]|nr:methionyl-tRNA formyltransferase [Roseburia sp.]
MKIVFMGTPDLAKSVLEAIIRAGHEVTAVVTQPDKPKGRSGQMQFPPVKECALQHGIAVLQPAKIKAPEAVQELRGYEADIFVVVAFGQILSKEILDMPRLGCVNVHASLLPKYRGAAPINRCIIDGEQETGVTIQQMDEGLDTGDILSVKTVSIDPRETAQTLYNKLADAGAELIVDTLPRLERGELTPVKQEESRACYAKKLDKALGEIDWSGDAVVLERLVRGLNPWPSAYTWYQGKSVKLWDCAVADTARSGAEAGTITAVAKDSFDVACGTGSLRVFALQLEGKKRMDTKTFLLGNPWKAGMRLGKE